MKLPRRVYVYFVLFKGRTKDREFQGFSEVSMNVKIKSMNDLYEIQARIQNDMECITPPLIENYQLMRTEWRRS